MKFAIIDADTFSARERGKSTLFANLGDHIQLAAIGYLYKCMGIQEGEIKKLSWYELPVYAGENVLLPINIYMNHMPLPSGEIFSPNIFPVYIGACIPYALPNNAITALKKWEPIGCRDEGTYQYLKNCGIDVYLAGCITLILPNRGNCHAKRTFMIDAPEDIASYMPPEILNGITIRSNGVYGDDSEFFSGSAAKFAEEKYDEIKQEAALVITSRLHVAAPCLAWGIPVIICLDSEKIPNRYAWIDKYVPVYTRRTFKNIDWHPSGNLVDEDKKQLIIRTATGHIWEKYYKFQHLNDAQSLTNHYLNRVTGETMSETDALSRKVGDILKSHAREGVFRYAIWGVTLMSLAIHNEIQKQCSTAQLTAVYDTYQTGCFLGKPLRNPAEISRTLDSEEKCFYIVGAEGACVAAKNLFEKLGMDSGDYWICGVEKLPKL